MKGIHGSVTNGIFGCVLLAGAHAVGCGLIDSKTAKDALTIAQVACIIASQFDTGPEVMQACEVQEKMRPAVEDMLRQKRAAKRAAACAPDAGE